jgi:hypothetical protein
MIPAGGIVAAPEYTRVCTCQFKNKTSLAMIHMPEMEMWGYGGSTKTEGRVRRVGVNFNAPGDRLAENGTLWVENPDVGGPGQPIAVTYTPSQRGWRRNWMKNWRGGEFAFQTFAGEFFRHHSITMKGGPLPWVTGSGLVGVQKVTIQLVYPSKDEAVTAAAKKPATYTVRLYAAHPDRDAEPGSCVFGIKLQGREVRADFDLVKEADGPQRGVMKEFKGIEAGDSLVVECTPKAGKAVLCGVEVVIEE